MTEPRGDYAIAAALLAIDPAVFDRVLKSLVATRDFANGPHASAISKGAAPNFERAIQEMARAVAHSG